MKKTLDKFKKVCYTITTMRKKEVNKMYACKLTFWNDVTDKTFQYLCFGQTRSDAWEQALRFRDEHLENPKDWGVLDEKVF